MIGRHSKPENFCFKELCGSVSLWLTPIVNDVAAIILAAGRSRRMGKFKPLLPFGDKTVIECCVSNLRAAGVNEIVVVLGHNAEAVRRQLSSASVTFATNPDPDSSMSASIVLGIEALADTARAVLITPADHPAIYPEAIGRLMEKWRGGAQLIQPEFQGKGGHPVLIDLSYRGELKRLDPHAGLRGFFSKHRADVDRLPVDSPFVARDMDTWEDYCALHEDVFGRKPKEIADLMGPNA
ncbi:MAG TPA: nucleotidyltransferase family protein [Pyrinomonadaceae bacterium]|nr:nucleotidyltransferase family protein [Pyrinomonadaceae bacterium]